MISKIDPERHADTGFSVRDTPSEVPARVLAAMRQRTPGGRLPMCLDRMATARILARATSPGGTTSVSCADRPKRERSED